ncbi:MAG TPA: hypothetical protein VMC10_20315 [Stellaceae bacterium]|nr:hypothetical protein [Stellaceae bacterium]
MRDRFVSRRGFLLSTTASLGGILALATGSNPVAAFEVQSLGPGAPLALDIKNRCSVDVTHDDIRAGLERDLLYRSAAPGTTLTETAYCPLCGCPIVATRYVK